ncbi:MAG: hypothetical protein RIC55_14260 [Pirellulaceae bacterium]
MAADGVKRRDWRRYLRFRLRSLVVVSLALAFVFAWGAQLYRQHRAVSKIEAMGGELQYDYQFDREGKFLREDPISVRGWLRTRLGDEWFGAPQAVDLSHCPVTDKDLRHLSGFTQLRRLQLERTNVTGSGFVHLRSARRLEEVYLARTPMTETGLAHLRELGSVHFVDLWNVEPTEAMIRQLERFDRLTFLEWNLHPADETRLRRKFPDLLIYSP